MSWIPAGLSVLAGLAVFLYKIGCNMEKEMEAAMVDQELHDNDV